MYMAGLHNNHFRKNHDWLPTIYKTKSYKQIKKNKFRFKNNPLLKKGNPKSLSFIKASGHGHYDWNSKNFQLIRYHHKWGFRHFMQNKYLLYNRARKDGKHNFHHWNWMDFHKNHSSFISINDSMDSNYKKLHAKARNIRYGVRR